MAFRKDYREVPSTLRKRVLDEEKHCAHCFKPLPSEDGDKGQVDHIIPDYKLPKGHTLTRADVQLLCSPCHEAKTHKETTAARLAAYDRAKHPRYRRGWA